MFVLFYSYSGCFFEGTLSVEGNVFVKGEKGDSLRSSVEGEGVSEWS